MKTAGTFARNLFLRRCPRLSPTPCFQCALAFWLLSRGARTGSPPPALGEASPSSLSPPSKAAVAADRGGGGGGGGGEDADGATGDDGGGEEGNRAEEGVRPLFPLFAAAGSPCCCGNTLSYTSMKALRFLSRLHAVEDDDAEGPLPMVLY